MNDILLRIRKVFSDSGKSQTEIGKKISKTAQYVWKLLNDDTSNPSDSVIKDICREFNINEDWLRDGKGPMYKPTEDKLSTYMAQIAIGEDDFIKDLIEVYMELDQTSKDTLKIIANRMADKKNKRGQK